MRDVLVGFLTGEYARRADFYDHLHWIEKPPDTVMYACHDRSPAKGRNLIVAEAQRRGCRSILFLDDDMICPPDTLSVLRRHDVEIVSGLYCGRTHPHYPLAFSHFEPEGACVASLVGTEPGLLPVAAAGMGCCLIKTSVFDRLEPPYFRLGELNPEYWSDDIGFFKRVQMAGLQAYCDTTCRIGHIGSLVVWPERTAAGWGVRYDTSPQGTRPEPTIAQVA